MKRKHEYFDHYIAESKIKWDLLNQASESSLNWDDDKQNLGARAGSWLKGTGNGFTAIFNKVGKILGNKEDLEIKDINYQNFIKAMLIEDFRLNFIDESPSASSLCAKNIILRRLYSSLVLITGQTHPIYLTDEVFEHTMLCIAEAKAKNISGKKNYGFALAWIGRKINEKKFSLTEITFNNKLGAHNTSLTRNAQKAIDLKDAEDGTINIEELDDESKKLISIRAFLNVITLINMVKTDGEKILLNLLLLLIVTGMRFDEVASLRYNCLERVPLTGDVLKLAKKFKLVSYNLKIKYLGLKGSKQTIHWVEPHSIPLVESIVESVIELTQPYRKVLIDQRNNGFTNFLPKELNDLNYDSFELDELTVYLYKSSNRIDTIWAHERDLTKKNLDKMGIHPLETKPNSVETRMRSFQRSEVYYSRKDINDGYRKFAEKKYHIKGDVKFTKVVNHNKEKHLIDYEELLFIIAYGEHNLHRARIHRGIITYVTNMMMSKFIGSKDGMSIFRKYNLLDENDEFTILYTNMPRHNINTFLALADITDHLQAILMGRRDITQNQTYQHLSIAQEMAFSTPEPYEQAAKKHQLGLFDKPAELPEISPPDDLDELFFSSRLTDKGVVNPVGYAKETGQMIFDPNISLEANLKKSLHTYGDKDEQTLHLRESLSEDFMPDLYEAYVELVNDNKVDDANDMIKRHAELNPLIIGTCTRNLALCSCPFNMKCINGEECGYHVMTGRNGELENIVKHSIEARNNLKQLEELILKDDAYKDSISKARLSVEVFDKMKSKSLEALSKGIIVTLIERPSPEQLGPYRKPTTLVEYFSLERQRIVNCPTLDDTIIKDDDYE